MASHSHPAKDQQRASPPGPPTVARPHGGLLAHALNFIEAQELAAADPPGLGETGRIVAAELAHLGLDETCQAAGAVLPAVSAGLLGCDDIAGQIDTAVQGLVTGVQRLDAMREFAEPDAANGEQKAEQLRKLMLTMVEDVRVPVIKLAAELVHLRSARDLVAPGLKEAANVAMQLYAPLAGRLGMGQFKWELEDSAFRILDNAKYKELAKSLQERRADREQRIKAIMAELDHRLRGNGIEADISGRAKHIFSIWRKMQRKDVDFEHLFDLSAVRILVADVAACYTALGVVHGAWTHIPGEFDDYITRPKPNGYRSLHTAVLGPNGHTMEVQIRSHQMHAEAELGVAAHWRYKEQSTPTPAGAVTTEARPQPRVDGIDARVAWLRRLLDSGGDDQPSDFIEAMQGSAWTEHIYVLTPNGDILEMPGGATSLDFAYRVHTSVGHRCKGAKVNGKMVALTHELQSGDRVEVLTAKQGTPSRDWLNPHLGYLKTPRARAKVRQWFKQQDYDKNLAAGEELYRHEVKRLGVSEPGEAALLSKFNYARFPDLLAGLGCGDVSTGQLASALQQLDPKFKERTVLRPRPGAKPAGLPSNKGVRIGDLGPVLTHISNCCLPVPPETIAGFITRGRGVSIHRTDCKNFVRLTEKEADRLIDVDWGDIGSGSFPVQLHLTAYDRRGLLRDITTILAAADIDVAAIDSRGRREGDTVTVQMRVEVSDLAQLSRTMDILGRVKSVTEVRRIG